MLHTTKMENSVDSTIEKIKYQEQIKEAKLIEKREYNVTVSTLNRSIRNAEMTTDKLQQQIIQMQTDIENIQQQIDTEKYQRDAISKQVDQCYAELYNLRKESDRKITSVWKLRAELIEATKYLEESCDVRTLLVKTTDINLTRTLNYRNQQDAEHTFLYKKQLDRVLEKREEAIKKRQNLLEKPEKDGEYIRIKEALKYSEKMVSNLKDQKG